MPELCIRIVIRLCTGISQIITPSLGPLVNVCWGWGPKNYSYATVFSSMLLLAQHEIARSELLYSTVFYFNLLSCGYTDIMHWVNVNL